MRKQFWWLGTTSHIELHATLPGMAARAFDKLAVRAGLIRPGDGAA